MHGVHGGHKGHKVCEGEGCRLVIGRGNLSRELGVRLLLPLRWVLVRQWPTVLVYLLLLLLLARVGHW